LGFRGALLELVTAGFYRFWLATDIRRHLWSHTSVETDAPEYTGTAKELLLGFLFATAILGPVYVAYFLLGLEAERWKAFASAPLAIFFYLFYEFAVYRARRYRLTRTVWRGVRFGMGGSGVSYAWRVALWTLFAVITLGVALPWRQAALERFKMRHTFYGDLAGGFVGSGGGLFARGWLLWLGAMVTVVVPFASMVTGSQTLVGVTWIVALILWPFIYGAYKAIEWRWWVSGLRLGDVSFESDLGRGRLIGLYWKLLGWGVLLIIVFAIWSAAVVGGALWLSGADLTAAAQIADVVSQRWSVLIGVGLGYVVAALLVGMLIRIYLIHDVWRRVSDSVTVHNLAAAQDVAARGEPVSALGEGLAGGLDVVGF
jgi:uncharacterized membrane protein YjgN (DUF898 family)